jgi:hypothetical protein
MRRTRALLALLILLAGLFLTRESRFEPGRSIDGAFRDWLVAQTRGLEPSRDLILVKITDATLERRGWPWSPLDYALFMQAALTCQPSVIAIEPVLEWRPQELGEAAAKQQQYERILQDFIRRAPKVLLAAELGFPEDPEIVPPLQETPLIRKVRGDIRNVQEFTDVSRQPEEGLRLTAPRAFSNVPDGSAVTRSAPMVFRYRGQLVPSFPLQSVLLWFGLTTEDVQVDLGSRIQLGDKAQIPIDESGKLDVNFGLPVTQCDVDELLLAVEQVQAGVPPVIDVRSLEKKLLLLVRTDTAARTLQLPGRAGSRGELFGAAIATIQQKAFIRTMPLLVSAVIVAAVMLLAWFGAGWSWRRLAWACVVSGLAYTLVAVAVISNTAVALPLLLPGALLLFLIVAGRLVR